jgi:diguanylate cyclase (GGDEF)-like protein
MQSSRAESVTSRRAVRRWATPVLAVTLLVLTSAAVLGSWRQATIVHTTAESSRVADAYQRASYLAALEFAALQGVQLEPSGEERQEVEEVSPRMLAALDVLAADPMANSGRIDRLSEEQRGLQPAIADYLQALDRSRAADAQEVLEQRIEPVTETTRDVLLDEERHRLNAFSGDLARAQRESKLLQVGTFSIFVIGLAVLAMLGWSSRAHRREIERMAAQDALTGLPNRSAFHARAKAAFRDVATDGPRPTVLMLDLDGFKDVNDTLGHPVGDQLLIEVSHRLRQCIRAHDTIARLGGDEFAILLTSADPEIGERTAERVQRAFTSPFVVEDITLDIETSIGIATAAAGEDVATTVRHADVAMYAAKEHRLGQTRFDPDHAQDAAGRLTLLGALRRALDAGEIELHYQPKIAVETGEMIGAEALARWNHPTRGMVPPNEFIPVLERTSLVHRFTGHVLDLALGQARSWLDAGARVPVAVNISTRSLLDPGFPDTVAQKLLASGVPGDLLCLEITENTVMADPEHAIDVLRRIRALGVKTAIDDFGTGYSSMAYLKILPVDEIKVDRGFVHDMATDTSNHVLVESAVDLGHNLGLAVVAEGVEDRPTMDSLAALGCDIAQGFYIARPLTAAAFTETLDTSHTNDPETRPRAGSTT